jgi:hypothetical protein
MASTEPGPRDDLITRALERDMAAVAAEFLDESPLDAAEAPDRLARHAMDELRRELRVEVAAADVQAGTVNEILRRFAPGAGSDAEVALPARVLQGTGGDPRLVTSFRCRRCRQRRSARVICSSTLSGSRTSAQSSGPNSRALTRSICCARS